MVWMGDTPLPTPVDINLSTIPEGEQVAFLLKQLSILDKQLAELRGQLLEKNSTPQHQV